MADNREPPQYLLRWRDLVAWQPNVSFYLMKTWVEADLIHPVYPRGKKSKPLYKKDEIKRVLGINGAV